MKNGQLTTTLLLIFAFTGVLNAKTTALSQPEPLKVQITSVTVVGKYKGRTAYGNGTFKIRCNNNQAFICYNIKDEDGELIWTLGSGETLRSSILPNVVTGTEISPSNDPVDTYSYFFAQPMEILNRNSGVWDILTDHNIWVND